MFSANLLLPTLITVSKTFDGTKPEAGAGRCGRLAAKNRCRFRLPPPSRARALWPNATVALENYINQELTEKLQRELPSPFNSSWVEAPRGAEGLGQVALKQVGEAW